MKSTKRIVAVFLFDKQIDRVIFAQEFCDTETKERYHTPLSSGEYEYQGYSVAVKYLDTNGQGIWTVELVTTTPDISIRVIDDTGHSHHFHIE